jgi:hypothetical protein
VTPISAPPRASGPAPPPRQTILGLTLSVAGAAFATWLSAELISDPARRLVGAMVGALVPALLSEMLARGRTRPAVALLLAAIAVALTYVTVTTTNVVTKSPPTFPVPPAVQEATVPPPNTVPPATSVQPPTSADGEAVPSEVSCTSDGCSDSVTLRNLGDVPIEVRNSEIAPDPNSFNVDHACDYQTLEPGAECSFEVSYSPSAPLEEAQVAIHQNLPGAPWYVNLRGQGATTPQTTPTPTSPSRPPTPAPSTPTASPTTGDTDEDTSTP